MPETPATCVSWMAQPDADASDSGANDDSDLDVHLDGFPPNPDVSPTALSLTRSLTRRRISTLTRTPTWTGPFTTRSRHRSTLTLIRPPTPMKFRARKLPVFCAGPLWPPFKLMPQATNFSLGPAEQRNNVMALCPFDIDQGATSF